MSKHFRAQRRFAFFAIVTGFPALCLMITGVFGPAWAGRQGRDDWTIMEGVWMSVACPPRHADNESCVISTREWIFENFGLPGAFSVLEEFHWQELRVLTVCGLEGGLNAALAACIVLAKRGRSSSVCILTIGLVSSVASCILVLLPVLKVFAVSNKSQWRTDWSRLIAFAGCIVQFACAALYVFAVSQSCLRIIKRKDNDDDATDANAVVFERDSYDPTEGMLNPGLELPAYSETISPAYSEINTYVPPPPMYTDLPDDPSKVCDSNTETEQKEIETPS